MLCFSAGIMNEWVGQGTFLVRSSVAKNKDLEFRKEFCWTQSMEYLTSNKNLVNSVAIRSFEWLKSEAWKYDKLEGTVQ